MKFDVFELSFFTIGESQIPRDLALRRKTTDNEDHRLNHCKRYRTTNHYDDTTKAKFDEVYSSNTDITVRKIKIVLL